MNPTTDKALARQAELVVKEMPDEVLVYDLRKHKAHCLNQTAAFIWNHCDGQTSTKEIAALMEQEWHAPVCEDIVWAGLEELGRADLLAVRAIAPETQVVLSRRRLLRRMGMSAMLIPMVLSVSSPVAAAAASCVPESECDGTPSTNCLPCHETGSANCTKRCRPKSGGGGQCVGVAAGECP
ncbi:MAG TPA: PqqD family protein [Blastocatellia bacterium]|nr:PqqD family protein [Blastocatellia bacterium]